MRICRHRTIPGQSGVSMMNDLHLDSVWMLLLLPVAAVPFLLPYLWKERMGPVGMRYSYAGLVGASGGALRIRLVQIEPLLRFAALALLIVAAARPQLGSVQEIIRGEGVDIAVAIDISGSMGETDFQPHRLGAAKEIIAQFIDERQYDRIGLVVFSRDAFIQSPPTLDHDVLLRLLADVHLADELAIEDGTAIGSGLATAANMLKDSDAESRLVTLITDGVNNAGALDPITAARAAEKLGIKLYTIGVGGEEETGQQHSALDVETLSQIADITGARFYRASDAEGLRGIYSEINALEKSEVEVLHFTRYQELAVWFLLPALALLAADLVLTQTVLRKIP